MDNFQSTPLVNTKLTRRAYLVTYSQADLAKFPTRKKLGKCIKKTLQHWFWESQSSTLGMFLRKQQVDRDHYHHVALKLIGPKRWKSVKDSISSTDGVTVNFSDCNNN